MVLYVVVELVVVEFCSEELLFLDVVFIDEKFFVLLVLFKGIVFVCEVYREIRIVIVVEMVNM